jgi:hypothetical protein
MNPEIIYSNFRDEALARMFSADEYSTFVAMPFRGRFSYDPDGILKQVIQKAAAEANKERSDRLKAFQKPETVAGVPQTANVITEDIVKSILFSHFFLADLTGGNAGVLVETGIAMSFKPNTQIILITQDPLEQLHFDIRNNRVISYNPDGRTDAIKEAFLSAAQSFENDRARYVTQVSRSLSTDAIRTLHCYASWYQTQESARGQPGLFYPERMPPFFEDAYAEQALNMFQLTMLELYEKRMIWSDYSARVDEGGTEHHAWAVHVTRLGWLLIMHLWPNYTDRYCERII